LKRESAPPCETAAVRVAVVGHVEWIDFVPVERVPESGAILVAPESWGQAAGGGGVASVCLARLAGSATLLTALGDDAFGHASVVELEAQGVSVDVAWRDAPQRRGFCYLAADGERTITVLADKLRPRRDEPLSWDELGEFDGIYFTGGDAGALQAARAARVLVATARELPTVREAGVELDALVRSAADPDEAYDGPLDPPPRVVVSTEGSKGGTLEPGGRFEAAPIPGPLADSYGAGDAFAAGLTYALGEGRTPAEAAAFAASVAAEQLTRRGAY
jgi:ribokinase